MVAPGHGRFLSSQDDYTILPAHADQAAVS
jgi:hypothetical protein